MKSQVTESNMQTFDANNFGGLRVSRHTDHSILVRRYFLRPHESQKVSAHDLTGVRHLAALFNFIGFCVRPVPQSRDKKIALIILCKCPAAHEHHSKLDCGLRERHIFSLKKK